MKALLVILIICVLGIGYMLLETGRTTQQVTQLQNQMTSMQSQIKKEKSEAIQSIQSVRSSLNLHMAESSVEDATRDVLDQNFGQAESAIHSALDSLKSATNHGISSNNIDKANSLLHESIEESKKMDQKAAQTLNKADSLIRKAIAGS
ncbi:MAG: hypothetical protein ACYC9S_04000 [Leptospirales bacterium]